MQPGAGKELSDRPTAIGTAVHPTGSEDGLQLGPATIERVRVGGVERNDGTSAKSGAAESIRERVMLGERESRAGVGVESAQVRRVGQDEIAGPSLLNHGPPVVEEWL